jgi:large subunit ribosomal protein L6
MSKLAIFYINKPSSVLLEIFRWTSSCLLIKFLGAYGSIYYIFLNSIYLDFPNSTKFFIRMDPKKKDVKKFLGLFFTLFFSALQDVSLSYKFQRVLCLEVGFSHKLFISIPNNLYIKIVNKKNTKFLIQGFNRHLVHEFANYLRLCRFPNEYTLKGIHYKNQWLVKKAGKQAQQK